MTPKHPFGEPMELAAEHSDAPWSFLPVASTSEVNDARNGWILPYAATEDDPCVAYLENVGAADLALLLAAPAMLEVLRSVYEDLALYSKRLIGSYDTGAIALGSAADQVARVIDRATRRAPVGSN